uniref:PK_Tyr_Ser-Thr domain-containing protein n=1 Tax=Ascaris lumbricoides TaxID=6252 RepID=A0A0M3IFP7_ASCLU
MNLSCTIASLKEECQIIQADLTTECLQILSGKQPMDPPSGTPPKIATAMSICFTQDPEERPDFEALFRVLAPNEQPPPPMDMWDTYVA